MQKNKQNSFCLGYSLKNGYALVADDVPNMCKTIKNILRSIGVEHVVEVGDGDIALAVLKDNQHPKLEAIAKESHRKCVFALIDWYMPRMSGIDLALEIRADTELENIPLLMVTAESSSEKLIQASAEVGMNGILMKPFTAMDMEKKMLGIIKQRANPPEHVKLINAGETLMKQGRLEDSLSLFDTALAMSPQSTARVHVLRGEVLKEKGEYDEAENSFAQAMANNPRYLKTYVASADLYTREGKTDRALSSLKKAAEISPCNAERHATMGKIYLEKGDKEEARKAFKGAIEQDPAKAKDIAEICLEKGNAEEAEEYFRRSMARDPKNLTPQEIKEYVHIANRLGIALRRQGKVKEAIEEYQKACQLAPDDEAIYYNMGKAYLSIGNRDKAAKCFRKALELAPDFEEARVELDKL